VHVEVVQVVEDELLGQDSHRQLVGVRQEEHQEEHQGRDSRKEQERHKEQVVHQGQGIRKRVDLVEERLVEGSQGSRVELEDSQQVRRQRTAAGEGNPGSRSRLGRGDNKTLLLVRGVG